MQIALDREAKNDSGVVRFIYPYERFVETKTAPNTTSISFDLTGKIKNGAVAGIYYKKATLDINDPDNRILSLNKDLFVADELCLVWFTVDKRSGGVHVNVQTGFTTNTPQPLPTTNTKPYVSLIGSYDIHIPINGSYVDEGAIAFDLEDGDLTSSVQMVSNLNTVIAGTYTMTYTVTDSEGLVSDPVARIITVGSSSTVPNTPPVITVLGAPVINVQEGTVYNDPGATAFDAEDGDVTSSISIINPVNVNVPGVYTVSYTVRDSAGALGSKIRTVNVIANSTPGTPAPPTNLAYTSTGQNSVNLTWTKSLGATSYKAYLTNGVHLANFGDVATGDLTGLSDNTYNVVVRAVNANGESLNSNSVTFTIGGAQPTATAPVITAVKTTGSPTSPTATVPVITAVKEGTSPSNPTATVPTITATKV